MRPFAFTLEHMRKYKKQVLNKEKSLLRKLQANRAAIERQISDLESYRLLKQLELQKKQLAGMHASELSAHRFFMENSQCQLKDLRASLIRANAEVERQLAVVIAASQEISGLDKLEEKQREVYRGEVAKEAEDQIAEHVVTTLFHGKGLA